MDRIEMLIVALIGVQSDIISDLHAGFSWENLKKYRVRRTAIRTQIADEYRAMVEALEGMLAAAIDGDYSYDEHGGEWPEIVQARAALARVKGE